MKVSKRVISVVLSLALLFVSLPFTFSASAAEAPEILQNLNEGDTLYEVDFKTTNELPAGWEYGVRSGSDFSGSSNAAVRVETYTTTKTQALYFNGGNAHTFLFAPAINAKNYVYEATFAVYGANGGITNLAVGATKSDIKRAATLLIGKGSTAYLEVRGEVTATVDAATVGSTVKAPSDNTFITLKVICYEGKNYYFVNGEYIYAYEHGYADEQNNRVGFHNFNANMYIDSLSVKGIKEKVDVSKLVEGETLYAMDFSTYTGTNLPEGWECGLRSGSSFNGDASKAYVYTINHNDKNTLYFNGNSQQAFVFAPVIDARNYVVETTFSIGSTSEAGFSTLSNGATISDIDRSYYMLVGSGANPKIVPRGNVSSTADIAVDSTFRTTKDAQLTLKMICYEGVSYYYINGDLVKEFSHGYTDEENNRVGFHSFNTPMNIYNISIKEVKEKIDPSTLISGETLYEMDFPTYTGAGLPEGWEYGVRNGSSFNGDASKAYVYTVNHNDKYTLYFNGGSTQAFLFAPVIDARNYVVETTFSLGSNVSAGFSTLSNGATISDIDRSYYMLVGTNENPYIVPRGNVSSSTNIAVDSTFRATMNAPVTLKMICYEGVSYYYINGDLVKEFSHGYTDEENNRVGFHSFNTPMNIYNISVKKVMAASEVPELSSLSLTGATLNREFDPEVYNYVAQVPNSSSSIEVSATIGEENSAMVNNTAFKDGKATVSLKVGYNKLSIVVSNKSGSSSLTYTVIVKRDADLETVYSSSDRAQLHFSAQQNWINDPNGLVYNAYRDEYHLFYQHNPFGNYMGNMSWGHAVSKDLVNWEELPVALFADDKGAKWSGSAVIDKNNTSGLFDDTTHPDDRMVFFISNDKDNVRRIQVAYSTDGGRTLEYYNDGAFVLQVQDPKIVWHEESQKWLLIPTNGNIYYSDNLINWTNGGRTYQQDGTAFPGWECQDFYPLEVDGNPDNVKWVYNAAGSWYAVGRLDWSEGKYNFYAETDVMLYNGESNQEKTKTLENGYFFEQAGDKSLYATQSFFNDRDGRRIAISWLQSTQAVSTSWRGYQTLAYEQTLKSTADGGYILYSYPVEEVNGNRLNPIYHAENLTVGENTENILGNTNALLADIEAEITLGENTTEVGFTVRSNGTNYVKVYYDVANKQLVVDKTQSGSAYVGEYGNPTMPMSVLDGNKIKFRIVVDNGVLEFFGNDGEAPIVSMANPLQNGGMSFYVKGGDVTVNDLTVYTMESIWFDKYDDGDLNGDGTVDICDLVRSVKLVDNNNIEVKATFDLNADKKLDQFDMAELRKKLLNN